MPLPVIWNKVSLFGVVYIANSKSIFISETRGGFNQVQQQLDQMTLKPPPRRSVVDGGDGQGMGFESGDDTSREEPSESESEREDGPHIPLSG